MNGTESASDATISAGTSRQELALAATSVVLLCLAPTVLLRAFPVGAVSSGTHTVLGWTAIMVSVATAVLLLAYTRAAPRYACTVLGLGAGLVAAAVLDGAHVLVTAKGALGDDPLAQATWTMSRLGRPLLLGGGLLLGGAWSRGRLGRRTLAVGLCSLPIVALAAGAATLALTEPPAALMADSLLAGAVPLALFVLVAGLIGLRVREQCPGPCIDGLVLGMLAEITAQLHVVLGGESPDGPTILAVHALMIVAVGVPFVGLCVQVTRGGDEPQPILPQDDSERDLSTMFDVSVDMMCIAGFDARFQRVSPSFTRVLGWTSEELVTREFLDFVHPDDLERTVKEIEVLGLGVETHHFRNRYRSKDGSWRWLSWCSSADRETGKIYAVARDDTERVRYEENLERARDAARSSSRMAAQDLLTPAMTVLGLSRQVRGADDADAERIARLQLKAEELRRLVEELLHAPTPG